jgi:Sortase domain
MASGHHTSTSPPSFIPSARFLLWTLAAGAVLVTGAMHDGQPPQPSAGQAFSAPATSAPGRTEPPASAPGRTDAVTPAPGGTGRTQPVPGRTGSAAPVPGRTGPATVTPGSTAPAARPAVRPLPPAQPLRLRIPVARVNAPLTRLDLDASGGLKPPPSDAPGLAGWYAKGTPPGSTGTAVVAGHVDLPTGGPGVFYNLGALAKGATIEIDRADRRTAVFTVDAVELYDKKTFPSGKVYGSTGRPELRVITCGGTYVKNAGYQGNTVVYATLTAVR